MTLEEYFEQISAINKELAEISEQTKSMGVAGTAHPGNKAWESAMARQWRLIQASAEITAKVWPRPPTP